MPQTIEQLKQNITRLINEIGPEIRERVRNWSSRMRAAQRSRGGHLNDVIFHT